MDLRTNAFALLTVVVGAWPSLAAAADRPNVLFIGVDDLNDWIGCLGGHPQALTPNIDRLAASGILFNNAHCAAPACNPSRTALMTGISPHVSGMYENGQSMRDVVPTAVLMPKHFSNNGYWSAGSGKMLHYFIEPASWDAYFPKKETDNPFPRTLYPDERPVSLTRGGPWQYVETDWGPLDATDEEFGGDWLVSKWIGEQLQRSHDKPFFLACGIYRPHEPWFVPKAYFDKFPLEDIQLPPGYREDDLDDVPPIGQKMARNRYFAHIQSEGQWRQGVQGYLASIAFADAMIGRVLDALEAGPNAEKTIVVLWSDHGWQLGEKQHWQKYSGWRAVTRVPLIVRVPPQTPGLSEGTTAGETCIRPVNLLSLLPTLAELTSIETLDHWDGPSLVPLLRDPRSKWNAVSVTHMSTPGRYATSGERYRYIHYEDGAEELYDVANDRYEWANLANDPAHTVALQRLRAASPQSFAERPRVRDRDLPKLIWRPLETNQTAPASKPAGNKFRIVFRNRSSQPVVLRWMQPNGLPKSEPYATLQPNERIEQQSRPGAVWLLSDEAAKPLGYTTVTDRPSLLVIPDARSTKK